MLAKSAEEDLERHTLSRIPTVYGKLSYLASLRDPTSGTYKHHGLSAGFGRDEAAGAIRSRHLAVFLEWINLDLRSQYEDFGQYLAGLESPRIEVQRLLLTKAFQALVPASAKDREKQLFSGDFAALLRTFNL